MLYVDVLSAGNAGEVEFLIPLDQQISVSFKLLKLTIGHLNIIKRAKERCDYLIVGVSTDELVRKEKNKTPVIPWEERAEIIKALKYVDEVVPQPDKDKLAAWERHHFDKMFVGSDWQGTPQWKKFEEQFAPLGVEIVYLPHTDGVSSTKLTNYIKKVLEMSESEK